MNNHTTQKTKVQAVPKFDIKPHEKVKFTRFGKRHSQVLYMAKKPTPGIRRLDKFTYEVIKTGEVRRFEQNEGKKFEFLRSTFRRLMNLIKTNFDTIGNAENALFITLTYQENMQDEYRLYRDFEIFMKRLKRHFKGHKLDYIVVAEPQERGAWHLHLMLKSDQEKLFIDNTEGGAKTLDKLWARGEDGKGSAYVERLKSDDVGAYYVAYFTALEHESGKTQDSAAEYAVDKNGKRYKKGARLHFYPKHFKFYRCSRGISRPETKEIRYSDLPEDIGVLTRTDTYDIKFMPKTIDEVPDEELDDFLSGKLSEASNKVLNTIQYESYKLPQSLDDSQKGAVQPKKRKKRKKR